MPKTQPIAPRDQGSLRALRQLKDNLGAVLDVLLPTYGPGAAQQLVDTTKGHAVLLRGAGGAPVSAALLDVYGQVQNPWPCMYACMAAMPCICMHTHTCMHACNPGIHSCEIFAGLRSAGPGCNCPA